MPIPWGKEAKKKGEEEVERINRYSAWGVRKQKEAENIVQKRKEELRKINENARGKPFSDEEWDKIEEEFAKSFKDPYMRGEK